MQKYNQLRAMMAVATASFRSIIRSPSAIVFSLAFPLLFIIVFGFISGGSIKLDVGVYGDCNMKNPIYTAVAGMNSIRLDRNKTNEEIKSSLSKGILDAAILIKENPNPQGPRFLVDVQTSKASIQKAGVFKMLLEQVIDKQIIASSTQLTKIAELHETQVEGREYKTIDFILPGQLGFSILSAGVFGTAFVFVSLRQTLVIKRFFATPISRIYIVLGEAISRLAFSLIGSLIIIILGHFLFGFTLVHGAVTVINLLLLSVVGLTLFMGFGFLVSSIAKQESSIPPFANIITMPQFLLGGTFFSVSNFPTWLQPVSKVLPLTYLNDAMRKVAFDGAGMLDLGKELGVLFLWIVLVYALTVKFFKWE